MTIKNNAPGRDHQGLDKTRARLCPHPHYTTAPAYGKSKVWRGVLRVCVAVTAAADRLAGYAMRQAIIAEAAHE